MKRSLLAIIFLLAALSLSGEINGSFEVGNYIEEPSVAFTQIEIEWFIDWIVDFSLYGGWLTWFEHIDGDVRQIPFQDLYSIGARVYVGNFFFGIQHACLHPVFGGSTHFDLSRADSLTSVSAGVYW